MKQNSKYSAFKAEVLSSAYLSIFNKRRKYRSIKTMALHSWHAQLAQYKATA